MEAYSRDLMRGIDGGDDGEHKETVDLTLGLSLRAGDRFDYGAERRIGEGLLVGGANPGGGAEVQPSASATPQPQGSGNSIKEEPAEELRASSCPYEGTPRAQGQSLSSAVVSSSQGTNGVHQAEGANNTVMATASSPAPALRAAALGCGGGQQDDSEMSKVREIPLVSTSGLPNGRSVVGLLYEYSKVDEVTILCMCHGSFLTPAEFVEHAGGGQVANPLRRIFVMPPPWL